MTADEVRARVEAIWEMRGDDEAAHSAEDSLHQDVLAAVATKNCDPNAETLATIALTTSEVSFARWCA